MRPKPRFVLAVVAAVICAGLIGLLIGRAWGPLLVVSSDAQTAPQEKPSGGAEPPTPSARRGSGVRPATVGSVLLPPEDAPVRLVIDRLAGPARAGSAPAACRIAVELLRCRNAERATKLADLITSNRPGQPSIESARRLIESTEQAVSACRGVALAELDEAYRFQVLAARHGGLEHRRWLVHNPALDPMAFMGQLESWRDYDRRARSFAAEALQARNAVDLEMLVSMHAPAGVSAVPGTAKINDVVVFVALYDGARLSGVRVPSGAASAAEAARRQFRDADRRRYRSLMDSLRFPWTPQEGELMKGSSRMLGAPNARACTLGQ